MTETDVLVIGGGIVGLATAYQALRRKPGTRLVLVEKEDLLAEHQTGHNSGVLHSGIYYKPGSLKAKNCRAGKALMEAFCAEEGIDYEICGKVIVALDEGEMGAMRTIFDRGIANGVRCRLIGREELLELEPHVAGIAGIHVPEAGIVNYRQVCERLAERIQEMGGRIVTGAKVRFVTPDGNRVAVETAKEEYRCGAVVNCAGLYSDRVARLGGQVPEVQIVPFRGEYYELKADAHHLVRNLIYPVPDPSFPFLGVHFTRMIGGGVECGPNAVFAFAREGYTKWKIHPGELVEALCYPGFLRMAAKYWRTGAGEMWRSFSKRAFVRALSRLIPEICGGHLVAAQAGVRAQAVAPDGRMVDDFLILEKGRVINVCNAPSPAATASLNIGRVIAERLG